MRVDLVGRRKLNSTPFQPLQTLTHDKSIAIRNIVLVTWRERHTRLNIAFVCDYVARRLLFSGPRPPRIGTYQ